MGRYLHTALCFLIWLLSASKINGAGDGKIVGGRMALAGEFPFQLCMFGSYRCGGALITLHRFISVAHCFVYRDEVMDVPNQFMAAGVLDCSKTDDPYYQQRGIKNYVLHPEYKDKMDKTFYNDFAVGILDKPFVESDRVKPGKIPSNDKNAFRQLWLDYVKSGKTCLSMGFGTQMGKEGKYSLQWGNELKVIEVQPKDMKYCKSTLVYEADTMLDGEVCATAVNLQDESMAPGDSGSGFVCDGFLYGVNTGGLFMEGHNLQLYTLAYPYLNMFTMDAAVNHSACVVLVICGILTVASVSIVHI